MESTTKHSKTFREAVSSLWSKEIDVTFTSTPHIELSTYKGEPALFISEKEEARLALPFQYTLVGKFPKGRPPMVSLRKDIIKAAFNGEVDLGLVDHQHILLKFQLECDFHRMWMKKVWTFNGFQAKIYRWTPDFSPEREPSTTPVWIKLPLLPLHLHTKEKLYSIGSAVGSPLKIDLASAAAEKVLRPSEARICVEIDVLKSHPHRLWIGTIERGYWQRIEFENVPEYCTECKKLGHSLKSCKNRQMNNDPKPQTNAPKIWAPVDKSIAQVQIREEDSQRNKGKAVVIENPPLPAGKHIQNMSHQVQETINKGQGSGSSTELTMEESGGIIKKAKEGVQDTNLEPQTATNEAAREISLEEAPKSLIREEENQRNKGKLVVIEDIPQTAGEHTQNMSQQAQGVIDLEEGSGSLAEPTMGNLTETTKYAEETEQGQDQVIQPAMKEAAREVEKPKGTSPAEESTWVPPKISIAKEREISIEADCVVPFSLPRTESAPLLRIHWLDKVKPKPGIPDMDSHSKLPNLDDGKGDNILLYVQLEEQVTGQNIQSETPVKSNRYNLRSLSKEEICKIQSSRKNKKKEARRNALEFSYSDSDTHFDID